MTGDRLTVALLSETFFDAGGPERLRALLGEARARGAELAVLPEIALDPWVPATSDPRERDAEPPEGPRHRRLAAAAREHGIAIVGGAIVRDPSSGRRTSLALAFGADGALLGRTAKLHLPEEPGFWETSHYQPGLEPPRPIPGLALAIGVQICSDNNRPEGTHLLAALGAEAVLAPRATERRTYARWRTVFQANALTSACYVISVNRPRPEDGVLLGGPSIVVAPDGEVLAESEEPILVAVLERSRVGDARRDYPGYLPVRSDLYARGWSAAEPDPGYRKHPSGRAPETLPRR